MYAKVAVFDTQTLRYIFSSDLSGQDGHAPWCAINPLNGLLYTSSDHLNDERGYIHVYEIVAYDEQDGIFDLNYLGQLITYDESDKRISTDGVQGGVFSKTGHMYLSIWKRSRPLGGIWGFDMITGRRVKEVQVDYNPTFPRSEELEGMTIWDVDTLQSPGISGQIHLVMIDNDWPSDDDLYFKHFSVGSQRDVI